MGFPFFVTLDIDPSDNSARYYCCRGCYQDNDHHLPPDWNRMTHIALYDQLLLRGATVFTGKHTHLFQNVVNVTVGQPELHEQGQRQYQRADVYCNRCNRLLGWRVISVLNFNPHVYLEGRFLLDRTKIDRWTGQQEVPDVRLQTEEQQYIAQ